MKVDFEKRIKGPETLQYLEVSKLRRNHLVGGGRGQIYRKIREQYS